MSKLVAVPLAHRDRQTTSHYKVGFAVAAVPPVLGITA
jgi:hypothetical protein